MAVSLTTTTGATQGTVTSTGLGSGIDISTLTTNLVAATITPQQTLLKNAQTVDTNKISALGYVQASLASLQSSIAALYTGGALKDMTATSSDTSILTATATSGASASSYTVKVQQLAQANKLASDAFTSSSATVGTGSVTLTAGGKSFSVSLTSGSDTLQDLADQINNSSSNSGVTASIITATDGAHLELTATATGTANAVSVSSSLTGGASSLSFSSLQDASDAIVYVDGYEHQSSSNTVTDAVSGLTLNLVTASPNTSVTLNLTADTSSAESSISSFVSAYNSALGVINQYDSYDSSTSTAGVLLGDSAVGGVLQQMQSLISQNISGVSLSSLGITVSTDGTLSVDSTTLESQLQTNLAGAQALFSGTGGLGSQLNSLLETYSGTDGILDSKVSSLQDDYSKLGTKLTDLSTQSAALSARYLKEFNNMDSIVSKYTNISSLLTKTFNALTSTTSSNSSSS